MDDVPWFEPTEEDERELVGEIRLLTYQNIAICDRIVFILCSAVESANCFCELPREGAGELSAESVRAADRILAMLENSGFGQNLLALCRIKQMLSAEPIFLENSVVRPSYLESADRIVQMLAHAVQEGQSRF